MNPNDEPTQTVGPNSTDPIEIARKHRSNPLELEPLPESIGPYKIIANIGIGGMGVVYLAEQSTPFRRVAIKIIHPQQRTKAILGRFEIEREALAMMDHPNIAKVYDAGESHDGRPYFVMEYVHGIPITEYCDMNKLTTNERLALFVDVCRAVHHAHQKGIIHRDIKPENVLVAVQENRPIVKVIDFGVAKAVQHRFTEKTVFTQHGQLIGTPDYMSPEQAEMGRLDIDTRTDIYSLGVLLYELLVGSQPFGPQKLRNACYGEIQRVIREVDPQKPSTRLSSLGGDSTVVASNHRTVVRLLSKELRGDLDWITMKCLEKDRIHRYDSATALADDIERHLRAEPVLAGPPSVIYKLRKFTRRHRFGVLAGTGIAAAILAGFIGTSIQYARANREWKRAEEKAATATQVTDFMVDLFKVNDPAESLGRTIPVREILDLGAVRIRTQLADQPLIQAALMDAIGSIYSNLGLFEEAEELLREAVKIRKREVAGPAADTAKSLHHLGVVLERTNRATEALQCHEEGLRICEQLYGKNDVRTTESLAQLASSLHADNERDEADRLFQQVLATRRLLLPPDDMHIADALFDVASMAHDRGEWSSAQATYEQAAAIYDKAGSKGHLRAVDCRYNLADLAFKMKDYATTERMYAEIITSYERIYGSEHPQTTSCQINYANFLGRLNRYEEAIPIAEKALLINQKKLGPDHELIASNLNLRGALARGQEDFPTALEYCRNSLEMRLRLADRSENPSKARMSNRIAISRVNVAQAQTQLNQFKEALTELQEALRIFEANSHIPYQATVHKHLSSLYKAWGQPEKAEIHRETADRLVPPEPARPPQSGN